MPPETVVIALSHEEAQVYDSESKTQNGSSFTWVRIFGHSQVTSRVEWTS
jgi:hypothetical protein